jgi:hypothetical protein
MQHVHWTITQTGDDYHITSQVDDESGDLIDGPDLGKEYTLQDVAMVILSDDLTGQTDQTVDELIQQMGSQIKDHGESMVSLPLAKR